jgi:pilus assembly protein CpaF
MIERVVDGVVESAVPLDGLSIRTEALRIAAEEAPLAGPGIAADVVDALVGLGPLEPLLRDAEVSDVLVNGPDDIWIERRGALLKTDVRFAGSAEIVAAVDRIIAPLGLRLDRASPAVDARLPDGSRLHALVPPASVDGPIITIRRFTEAVADLDGLVATGGAGAGEADYLARAVESGRNIVVSGGTGSGKTTLLNILSKRIPHGDRLVTVEDAAELRLSGHVVRLEAHPPNAEGAGEVRLQDLVRHALRLRPDRIIVGEVRGAEALDMIQAMMTGHDGSMSTVHASSPTEALLRLETLAGSGERIVAAETIRRQLHSAVNIIVQTTRRGGRRRIVAIAEVGPEGGLMAAAC